MFLWTKYRKANIIRELPLTFGQQSARASSVDTAVQNIAKDIGTKEHPVLMYREIILPKRKIPSGAGNRTQ